jgi:hypothetical protein
MAGELENTGQIITKTGMFNNIDRIYGDVNAQPSNNNASDMKVVVWEVA